VGKNKLIDTPVTRYLDQRNIPYKIKMHKRPVFTSEEAAEERGVRLSQIVKTMFLSNKKDETVMVILPGHRRLDKKKIEKLSGYKKLEFMDKASLEKKGGLIVGAIPPVGEVFEEIPKFLDPSVFNEEWLDISSGDPQAGLELRREDLRGILAKATVAEIVKEE
jgi:Cys-tRNA(Pro) deacylase